MCCSLENMEDEGLERCDDFELHWVHVTSVRYHGD